MIKFNINSNNKKLIKKLKKLFKSKKLLKVKIYLEKILQEDFISYFLILR